MESPSKSVESACGPVIINVTNTKTDKSEVAIVDDYLNEYDNYYLDHEKYLNAGHGGKQRNKKEVELNSKRIDPSGNVRIIVSKMQNFEHNRRKSASTQ